MAEPPPTEPSSVRAERSMPQNQNDLRDPGEDLDNLDSQIQNLMSEAVCDAQEDEPTESADAPEMSEFEKVAVAMAQDDDSRDLMFGECDLVYECRVCSDLSRSLESFVEHKQTKCKAKYKDIASDAQENAVSEETQSTSSTISEKQDLDSAVVEDGAPILADHTSAFRILFQRSQSPKHKSVACKTAQKIVRKNVRMSRKAVSGKRTVKRENKPENAPIDAVVDDLTVKARGLQQLASDVCARAEETQQENAQMGHKLKEWQDKIEQLKSLKHISSGCIPKFDWQPSTENERRIREMIDQKLADFRKKHGLSPPVSEPMETSAADTEEPSTSYESIAPKRSARDMLTQALRQVANEPVLAPLPIQKQPTVVAPQESRKEKLQPKQPRKTLAIYTRPTIFAESGQKRPFTQAVNRLVRRGPTLPFVITSTPSTVTPMPYPHPPPLQRAPISQRRVTKDAEPLPYRIVYVPKEKDTETKTTVPKPPPARPPTPIHYSVKKQMNVEFDGGRRLCYVANKELWLLKPQLAEIWFSEEDNPNEYVNNLCLKFKVEEVELLEGDKSIGQAVQLKAVRAILDALGRTAPAAADSPKAAKNEALDSPAPKSQPQKAVKSVPKPAKSTPQSRNNSTASSSSETLTSTGRRRRKPQWLTDFVTEPKRRESDESPPKESEKHVNAEPATIVSNLSELPVEPSAMQKKLITRSLQKTTEGYYSCSHCEEQFEEVLDGRRHIMKHLNLIRFICSFCQGGSFFAADMRKHLMEAHCHKLKRAIQTEQEADRSVLIADPEKSGGVVFSNGKIISSECLVGQYPSSNDLVFRDACENDSGLKDEVEA